MTAFLGSCFSYQDPGKEDIDGELRPILVQMEHPGNRCTRSRNLVH